MVKKEGWKKETARDFLAIGSWIFYILVIARLLIGPFFPWVYQFIIAGSALVLLSLVIKDTDDYVARGLILIILTSFFYYTATYTVFVILAFVGLLISSRYVGNSYLKIIKGIIIGVVSTGLGYYLGLPLPPLY